jgi:uncharacterized protein YodC (DUF2158 family)
MCKFNVSDSVRIISDPKKTCMTVTLVLPPMVVPNFNNFCAYSCVWMDVNLNAQSGNFPETALIIC